ncbi:hypothetical protein BpHYR1_023042 [Brachionus plicatilis]|uniref:Uncharacterized protein n=1 Tax=Brachionus plicatilis TaxID=10195 RepID=A0A3M7QMY7_BRAPC|nr:hypothetical protein BpHYR1_023042 [Brachionus plicatilis]
MFCFNISEYPSFIVQIFIDSKNFDRDYLQSKKLFNTNLICANAKRSAMLTKLDQAAEPIVIRVPEAT